MSDEAQAPEPRKSGRNLRISLDAMGGDFGPSVTVPGAALALERHPDSEFLLFGRESEINRELEKHPALKARARVIHTDVVVSMDEKPSQALRQGRYKSSMWMAIDAVRKGEADVCCSAGNTGALMVMSRFCLRMMPGIDRPALACMWPTARGESIVLDVGASIGATAENLVDMAIMGSAMARIVFDLERPTVGLLNVGVEEIKGVEQVKEAGSILREVNLPNMNYIGFVEGDDIGKGRSDVVVTEGFAGNIALKTAEGTAKQIGDYLKSAIQSSVLAKIGYLFARGAFNALRKKMDPRRVNGAVFLGLNGVVVKSHGGTDALGFASAVDVAYDMAKYDRMAKIGTALAERGEWILPGASSAMVENRADESSADKETGTSLMRRSRIAGVGSYLPARIVTNAELAERMETSDDWIRQRTGIGQRHIAAEGETTSMLGLKAAEAALAHAGLSAQDIDLIVLATATPDYTFPSTATQVQAALGITHGAAFDVAAVCSGFVYALTVADKFITSGANTRSLVIGAETFSRILDWEDRTTAVLFGDGAGAVVLEAIEGKGDSSDTGVLTTHLRSDGRHRAKLYVDGGPSTTGTVGHLRMEGREVFKHAVGMITDVIVDAFAATGYSAETIDWFVPHQANQRIITASAEKLGIAMEKVVLTVDRHGNTSAASIPLALDAAVRDGRIQRGQTC